MPGVTRKGDTTTGHDGCFEPTIPTSWAATVLANDLEVVRVDDTYRIHGVPPCIPHVGSVLAGSPNVFVEDKAVARIGDKLTCNDTIATGSGDVSAN